MFTWHGAFIYSELVNLSLNPTGKMLGKDIRYAEEAEFGKGGWWLMGRGLETPCSKETGLAFLATFGFFWGKNHCLVGACWCVSQEAELFPQGLIQPEYRQRALSNAFVFFNQ